MANKSTTLCLLVGIILIISIGGASAGEKLLPSVEINGDFLSFRNAVALRGGILKKKTANSYLVNRGKEYFEIKPDGSGLSAVKAALFPETILVSFIFKNTLGSAKTFINGSGPIPSIKIDRNGNGQGNAYIFPSRKIQNIELRSKAKVLEGHFSLINKNRIICTGRKNFFCD